MIYVELALVVAVVWGLVHLTLWLLDRTKDQTVAPGPTRWRVTHYDTEGETRIVLQRHDDRGNKVGGQHVVTTVPLGAPDYEARFLAGMDSARQRRALFETEEDE